MVINKSAQVRANLMQAFFPPLSEDCRPRQKEHRLSSRLRCRVLAKRTRYVALALILFTSLAWVNLSAAAGRVFYDGFEDSTTNQWQQADYCNRCSVVSSAGDGVAGPYAGSRMARCNWNGTVAWNDPAAFESLMISSVPYTNEIFYRVRLRIDKNVERTDGSPLKMLRIFYWDGNQSTYRDMFEDSVTGRSLSNRGDGTIISTTYWGGDGLPGDNTGLSSGWHTVEYYINHATGKIRVWHDGVMIRDDTKSIGSQKWYPFYLTSNWSDGHDGVNYIYFDEIEIYSDTGTGATGSMSDASISAGGSSTATVPNPPGNLQIQ